jgi:hypothetical protein
LSPLAVGAAIPLIPCPSSSSLSSDVGELSELEFTQRSRTASETEDVATMFVRDFPDDLHRRAKVVAASQGETLKALVERAIEAEVERAEAEIERKRKR